MPTTASPDPMRLLVHAENCPAKRFEVSAYLTPDREVLRCLDCGAHFPPADGVERGPMYKGDPVKDYDRALDAARRRLGEVV